jgi:hypothetical protein
MKTKHVMKLHPWQEVLDHADKLAGKGIDCYQQFNCEHCGAKQTMEKPNVFHISGICEECGGETDIKKNGHNYMVHAKGPAATTALLKEMGGDK